VPSGEAVYVALRAAITNGRFQPGARLLETELSERFHVSRTPIREALKHLEGDELVTRDGPTLVVAGQSNDEIMEIYEIRIALNSLVAQLAAERAKDTDLIELRSLLERFERAGPIPSERAVALATEFDRTIWRVGRNTRLYKLLDDLFRWQHRFHPSTLLLPGRLLQVVAEHRALLEAIEARDSRAAAALGREHLLHARDARIQMNLQRLDEFEVSTSAQTAPQLDAASK
jgi:DNA-binding GntR family transcriptional regulator